MTTRINNSISAEEEACLNELTETDNEAYPWTGEEILNSIDFNYEKPTI